MKPGIFEYRRVSSTDEALVALQEEGDDVRVLAGGQSLIAMMNLRIARPTVLVDIGRVDELAYVRRENGDLCVGATTRQATVEHSIEVAHACPLVTHACRWIGHRQIRSRGTVGGSVAHADPAAELPAVAMALDARMVIRSTDAERTVAASDFFQSLFTTALSPGEILTAVRFPTWGRRAAFSEVARRHGDFAIAAVAAAVDLDAEGRFARVGIGLGGVGPVPLKAVAAEALLVGETPTTNLLDEAAQAAAADARPASDQHGSAGFRRHLVRVLTIDALSRALTSPPSERVHG
jgi:CO/xanthine dehydrogenase FAD-binding subunit